MKNILKAMRISSVRWLCLVLAALMLLSGCTQGSINNGDDTTTTTTSTTTKIPDSNNNDTPPAPITGSFESQSVAIGQKLIITCSTDSKCTFFLTNTAAEVVENEFDAAKSISTITVLGKIPGKTTLVGVSEAGNVSHATVNVYAPAAEGEVKFCIVILVFEVTLLSSSLY